jgi:hypothetical protein
MRISAEEVATIVIELQQRAEVGTRVEDLVDWIAAAIAAHRSGRRRSRA